MPSQAFRQIAEELQDLSVVHVTLTGGEPLLREDLEQIARFFDKRTYLALNTTGDGLTLERCRALRDSGIFSMGVSLDSTDPDEHDRMRGIKGAFRTAVQALNFASTTGLYPYIISVATHAFLQRKQFEAFLRAAADYKALEVHLLEPSATGKLAGRKDIVLKRADRNLIIEYQQEIAQRDDLPALSSFMYLESPQVFGCGAGLTHLYIDGSGEVCPCNLVPLSFGNILREPLQDILDRMGCYFRKPRPSCIGTILAKHIHGEQFPLGLETSIEICESHLPVSHALPRFFQIRAESQGDLGPQELQSAYNRIHAYYDEFWLNEAGKPIADLVGKISFTGKEHVFEAGCGTGFATVLISRKLRKSAGVTAVDLSEGMLVEARKRTHSEGIENVRFVAGDALAILKTERPFDLIFASWVLGYISLAPFFIFSHHALKKSGRLAFVVHKENSPYEPLEIFWELVARDPTVLQKRVAFDFPKDMNRVERELRAAGFEIEHLWDGQIVFRYDTPEEVLEHILKSGAGTAFYDALDPTRRKPLEDQFLKALTDRKKSEGGYEVIHDYISCIAGKS